jgi:[protein-PII] uridylyltransferase
MITVTPEGFRTARAATLARTDLRGVDLVRVLAREADRWFAGLATVLPDRWALVATGGYAHNGLCPGSDVDVVLLHPKGASAAQVDEVARQLWYPSWDAGMKLSPAVHDIQSAMDLAHDDLTAATSLLQIRRLAGSEAATEELQGAARAQWRRRSRHWLHTLRLDIEQRHAAAGEVAYLLEPDIKDGQGGLRDVQSVHWALATEATAIHDALERPVKALVPHQRVLTGVRAELHRATGRTSNTLILQDQTAVAAAAGYADSDALMSDVSAAARAIDWATDRFWWRVGRVERRGWRRLVRRNVTRVAQGVGLADGEVVLSADFDRADPVAVLRVAAAAASANAPISREALVELARIAQPIPEPWPENARRALLNLLSAGRGMIGTVEELDHYDLFQLLLPEWEHVRARPQRNAFHRYTVDRHLLETVANAAVLARGVSRPDLLLLGALLHDIGKGQPGDHTDEGMVMAEVVLRRIGAHADDTARVIGLIQHHLLLPETATRRDLNDPRTAQTVAEAVGDIEQLRLLRTLTEADAKATGPTAWTGWRVQLVDELVERTAAQLEGRRFPDVTGFPAERHLPVLERTRAAPNAYVEVLSAGEITTCAIAAPDRPGLFASVVGALAVHGADVISADVWTTEDGTAVDEFSVVRRLGGDTDWRRVEHDLRGALNGTVDLPAKLASRTRTYARSRRAQAAAAPRLDVTIDNDASARYTVIEVRAPDGIAVLHRLAAALYEAELDLAHAKVATLGHEVVDVFYVRSGAGPAAGKVAEAEHAKLRTRLIEALTASDVPD